MKLVKTLAAAAVLALSSFATQASTINVGGVTWDPDNPTTGALKDFTGQFQFAQWYTKSSDAVSNTTNATADLSKAILPSSVVNGDVLQGVGRLFQFNNLNPNQFCSGCELTFVFGGFTVIPNPLNAVNFSVAGGWLNIYVDSTPDFDMAHIGSTEHVGSEAKASDGDLFLSLVSVANDATIYPGFASGSVASYFKATGGLALSNFDTNFYTSRIADADALSAQAAYFNNPTFAISIGSIGGDTVPTPSSLAVLGLGLIGLAGAARRKSSK